MRKIYLFLFLLLMSQNNVFAKSEPLISIPVSTASSENVVTSAVKTQGLVSEVEDLAIIPPQKKTNHSKNDALNTVNKNKVQENLKKEKIVKSVPVPLPLVKAKVIKKNKPKKVKLKQLSNIILKPGVNEIIPVSRGHLNRIVTPFESPKIKTASDATISVENNVVYVVSDKSAPISLFLTPSDSEGEAISVTLIPKSIPPREITLAFAKSHQRKIKYRGKKKAKKWEQSQAYVETIKKIFRDISLGKIPPGYSFKENLEKGQGIFCDMDGFTIKTHQMLEGSDFIVLVGVLKNTSKSIREFDESSCSMENVLSVAVWPDVYLAPGQSSEIYVINRFAEDKASQGSLRPSLLTGASYDY